MNLSNMNKWNDHYKNLDPTEPGPFDLYTDSFKLGAEWLSGCKEVEDWGCGKGAFADIATKLKVTSLDGSKTPFADKIVDLAKYKSSVDGIFMRSVAEHNFQWEEILTNLAESFKKKAFVQFYTPMNNETNEALLIQFSPGFKDIPELSIPSKVWENILLKNKIKWKKKKFSSTLAYGEETCYFLSR